MNWKINVLAAAVLIFAQSCQEQTQQQITEEFSYAHPESIIEVSELIDNYSNYTLVDLRKKEDYDSEHLPGALQVWRSDITDTSYAYGGMMPSKEHLEELLGSLGISSEDTIVVYDDKAECDAARLWWLLKFYGHDQVKLLNGGLVSWKEAGGEVTDRKKTLKATAYHFIGTVDSSHYANISAVKPLAFRSNTIILLDTRSYDEFSGGTLKNGAATAGSIPNSINLDWTVAVDFNGNHKFRTVQELKSTYQGVGMNTKTPVITYCHSGVRSAHTLFVLTQILGYENVRNYDGSWIEWSHLNTDTTSL